MNVSMAVLVVSVAVLLSAGCIMAVNNAPPPRVKVEPCTIASTGMQVRVSGLETTKLKKELQSIYVDDFASPSAKTMVDSYTLKCDWGNSVGERRDYYYCKGSYKAPDLDENRVIRRWVMKEFKIGFDVEEHDVGSWVDSTGAVHNEGNYYYLTSKSAQVTCYLA
jgi:hypothetical protein